MTNSRRRIPQLLQFAGHLGNQRCHRRALVATELAAKQVVGLNARRTFVNSGDAHVAQVLRGPRLLDKSHSTVNLHAEGGDLIPKLRAPPFDHRNEKIPA